MSRGKQDVVDLLRRSGYSVTEQRLFVFGLLDGDKPLSMAHLIAQASGVIDRASLYRTVALFEKLGIVRRVHLGWKYKVELSDRFTEHHHHLTCLKCHAVIPIAEQELESFISSLAALHHFTPLEHQIEVQGYCAGCSSRTA